MSKVLYHNRPDLTAVKFVANPFGGGGEGRVYKTGDRAQWNAEGNLVFLGRFDDQVKIRGFCIEPGEVKAALCRFEGVTDAVAVAHELALVVYITPARLDTALLKAALAAQPLSGLMVPSVIVALATFPLTHTGKLDRKALPEPMLQAAGYHVAPTTAEEAALCRLREELLSVGCVGSMTTGLRSAGTRFSRCG